MHPGRGGAQTVAQGDQLRMEPQLQDRVHAPAGLEFELLQRVQVPRVDDQRLLADRVGARAQRQADVRVVQIVGRTDADEVDPLRFGASFELLEMPVEPLDFGEEAHVEGVLVQDADRVMRIRRRDEAIAGVLDGLEMSGGDEAAHAGHGEIFHCCTSAAIAAPACASRERSTTALSVAASVGAFTRRE